jgi:Double-GTPase 1
MSERRTQLIVVGLPESGKSTYLGALYYFLRKAVDPRLALRVEPEERDYLQELEDKWLRFQPFRRSTHPGTKPVDLSLKSSNLGELELSIPDISGETFDRLWENAIWPESVQEIAAEADGALIFLNPASLKPPDLIDVSTDVPSEADPVLWNPEMAPTQAIVCDLLEALIMERKGDLPPVAVVVSAWDMAADLGIDPPKWLELHVPLLWQWLCAREGDFETFGISAQGGDVSTEESRLALAADPDPLNRIRQGPGAHGLIDPILWLLDR